MIFEKQPSSTVEWQMCAFEALSASSLYEVLALRSAVFVVEQNCPYQDIDQKDRLAWHVLVHLDGQLVATARILPPQTSYPNACSIGRVCSDGSQRGKNLGRQLMAYSVTKCETLFPNYPIRIGAQQYLETFYQQFGFETDSEPYLEDGIWHIEMQKPALVSSTKASASENNL